MVPEILRKGSGLIFQGRNVQRTPYPSRMDTILYCYQISTLLECVAEYATQKLVTKLTQFTFWEFSSFTFQGVYTECPKKIVPFFYLFFWKGKIFFGHPVFCLDTALCTIASIFRIKFGTFPIFCALHYGNQLVHPRNIIAIHIWWWFLISIIMPYGKKIMKIVHKRCEV